MVPWLYPETRQVEGGLILSAGGIDVRFKKTERNRKDLSALVL
jgi:hypothetical protein